MLEEQLTTNPKHPIVRMGNEVHRPTSFWTPAVHELLAHLESVGFPYSPRVLGFDSEGREILSYFEGESGKEGWAKIVSDEGLQNNLESLVLNHDAVASFKPSENVEWADGSRSLHTEQIICHGDFGPWNIVWQGIEPVGLIDWDMAHPNTPEYDVLYGIEYSAPFRDNETATKWHAFPEAPDRKHRIAVFLEAYGISAIPNVSAKVASMQRAVGQHEAYLAKRGIQPQVSWVAEGDLEEIEKRANWTEANHNLF